MRASPRRIAGIAVLALAAVAAYALFVSTPSRPRDVRAFDPDAMATREVEAWKAYYDKRNVALFVDLVTMTRDTYRCSRALAVRIAFHLARAAATFGNLRDHYD